MERPAEPASPYDLPPPPIQGDDAAADAERDAELDRGLKETFPASDPLPPKHVD